MARRPIAGAVLCSAVALLSGCDATTESTSTNAAVVADSDGLTPVTTDLGYLVTLDTARFALRDFELTIEGEAHASLWDRARELLVATAHAHPGHYAGGEVTGELPGDRIVTWTAGGARAALGTATLLEGDYHGLNFYFRTAGASDGLGANDPLAGHSAVLSGHASKDGVDRAFTLVIDIDDGTRVVGAPAEQVVRAGTPVTFGFQLLTQDPYAPGTLFDGLDFASLEADGPSGVVMTPGTASHNIFRRTLETHDFYFLASTTP
ncbi:MAG: hypothetical protein H6744_02700 [Deltaproteobacteria bacterium]|nr:hypothetical protein [Deltaproteobacteria bacterium]MCB9785582.1 hypothetical protein [Deltaproteobacteria bacterium]